MMRTLGIGTLAGSPQGPRAPAYGMDYPSPTGGRLSAASTSAVARLKSKLR